MIALALGSSRSSRSPCSPGWVAYFLLCVIPMQIVVAVTWGPNPGFVAGRSQPAKGLLLTLDDAGRRLRGRRDLPRRDWRPHQSADADARHVQHRVRRHHVLGGDHVGRLAVHRVDEESDRRGARAAGRLLRRELRAVPRVLQLRVHAGRAGVRGGAGSAGFVPGVARAGFLPLVPGGHVSDGELRPVAAHDVTGDHAAAGPRRRLDSRRARGRRRRLLRRRRRDGHGSGRVHGARAGAFHLRNHRGPEHAEGFAVCRTRPAARRAC